MSINVGTADRTVRVVAGVTLVVLTQMGVIGTWGWVGLVPILTGMLQVCPAYSIFGFKTCALK